VIASSTPGCHVGTVAAAIGAHIIAADRDTLHAASHMSFYCGMCCAEGPSLRCACGIVWYCNKQHQRQHWSLHRASCVSVYRCHCLVCPTLVPDGRWAFLCPNSISIQTHAPGTTGVSGGALAGAAGSSVTGDPVSRASGLGHGPADAGHGAGSSGGAASVAPRVPLKAVTSRGSAAVSGVVQLEV
jgi:hypothetical protein